MGKNCISAQDVFDEPILSEMIVLCFYILYLTFELLLCMISIRQLRIINKKSKFPNGLYSMQIIFFISAALFFIFRVPTTITNCFAPEYYLFSWLLMFVFYAIHYMSLVIILYKRLRAVFDNTIHKLTNITVKIYQINFAILVVLGIALMVLIGTQIASLQVIMTLISLGCFDVVVLAQMLAWTFVVKLGKLSNKKSNLSAQAELRLLNTITKYSILSVISVMFTTIVGSTIFISSLTKWGYWDAVIQANLFCLDVILDTICMALSLQLNNEKYLSLCFCCDKRLKLCCANIYNANDTTIENIKEMSRSTQTGRISSRLSSKMSSKNTSKDVLPMKIPTLQAVKSTTATLTPTTVTTPTGVTTPTFNPKHMLVTSDTEFDVHS